MQKYQQVVFVSTINDASPLVKRDILSQFNEDAMTYFQRGGTLQACCFMVMITSSIILKAMQSAWNSLRLMCWRIRIIIISN